MHSTQYYTSLLVKGSRILKKSKQSAIKEEQRNQMQATGQ